MGEADSRDDQGAHSGPSPSKRRRRWIAATLASILVAGGTAFAAGLGSDLADSVDSSPSPLVSSYATEERAGCGPYVFLPEESVGAALAKSPTLEETWPEIQSLPGFAFADSDRVNVSIQGETARLVTLTGIYFHVTRRPRPKGALFYAPCGGPIEGRSIRIDVGRQPPTIVESNVLPHVPLGSTQGDGRPLTKPIKFPWTVSLTDPLLLGLIATTKSSCYCIWTAEIPWVSGGQHGIIDVDNGGAGYTVVSSRGLRFYGPKLDGGSGWGEQPPGTFSPS